MPPVSGLGTNQQKKHHHTRDLNPTTLKHSKQRQSRYGNDGKPAVNPEIVKGQEFDDLK